MRTVTQQATQQAARQAARHWARTAAGTLIGTATALAGLVFALCAGAALLAASARPGRRSVPAPVLAGARRLAEAERVRLSTWCGGGIAAGYGDRAALRYVAARWPLGLLGGLVLLCVPTGAFYATVLVWGWFVYPMDYLGTVAAANAGGLVLLFLSGQGLLGVTALEERLARRHLGPSPREELERRVRELAASRAGVVEAVTEERRRIERDLHDGVQQRLVALGMLLGRARRGRAADRTGELLLQAHREAQQALRELREVAWRIYPAVLDEAGLRVALETVAERSALPVRLDYRLSAPPAPAVASVAYFVVSEAVTNAVKHAGAGLVTVCVTEEGEEREEAVGDGPGRAPGRVIAVRITDDGGGGADPSGGGLVGLARRVAALDGRFGVDSPPGGPTTVTAELPCA